MYLNIKKYLSYNSVSVSMGKCVQKRKRNYVPMAVVLCLPTRRIKINMLYITKLILGSVQYFLLPDLSSFSLNSFLMIYKHFRKRKEIASYFIWHED